MDRPCARWRDDRHLPAGSHRVHAAASAPANPFPASLSGKKGTNPLAPCWFLWVYRLPPSRMKSIAIANQKGGVGKTTTAINLSTCLAQAGARVLLLDLDPQGNASSALGHRAGEGQSLYRVLIGHDTLAGKIQQTRFPNLSIIPAQMELAGCEVELVRAENHLIRLREVLTPLKDTGRSEPPTR